MCFHTRSICSDWRRSQTPSSVTTAQQVAGLHYKRVFCVRNDSTGNVDHHVDCGIVGMWTALNQCVVVLPVHVILEDIITQDIKITIKGRHPAEVHRSCSEALYCDCSWRIWSLYGQQEKIE